MHILAERCSTSGAEIVVLDGSRVATIARRGRLLEEERAVLLPGCLLALSRVAYGLCPPDVDLNSEATELTRPTGVLPGLLLALLSVPGVAESRR